MVRADEEEERMERTPWTHTKTMTVFDPMFAITAALPLVSDKAHSRPAYPSLRVVIRDYTDAVGNGGV